jgi:hypothetical protein
VTAALLMTRVLNVVAAVPPMVCAAAPMNWTDPVPPLKAAALALFSLALWSVRGESGAELPDTLGIGAFLQESTLMKRLYLDPSFHLVFKRLTVQIRPAVSFPDRAKLR